MYKDLMSTYFQKDYTNGFTFDYDNSLDICNNRSYERNDKSNAQSNIVAWHGATNKQLPGVTNWKLKDCYCRCEKVEWFKRGGIVIFYPLLLWNGK